MKHTMTNNIILNFIQNQYDFVKFKSISQKQVNSFNYIYILTDIQDKKYIAKIYRRFDINKIQKECLLTSFVKNKIQNTVCGLKNKNNELFAVDRKQKLITIIFPYIYGYSYRNAIKFTNEQIKKSAFQLAFLHNLNCNKKILKQFPVNNIKNDILKGIKIYKLSLKKIEKNKHPDKFEKMIKNVLKSRLNNITDCFYNIQWYIKNNNISVIHGDFAPSNIIFNQNDISVIDWERVSCYNWQYDLFRAISNFASSGTFTPFDSVKNINKVNLFLKYYFQKRNEVKESEIKILKIMPKLFCFIDTFPFESFFLKKEVWTKSYLPASKKAYYWWIKNENNFINFINKYLKK